MSEQDSEDLLAGLRALARDLEARDQAQARLETSLRTAYRRHRRQVIWRRGITVGAIAASVVLVVASAVVMLKRHPAPGVPTAQTPPAARPAEVEVTTGFLPVIGGDFMEPLDRGRVVRVQLPRSALRAFGLPMNEDRAEEWVKADVLLGEDGLARAVRFVQ
jgi:hypothetical protein